MGTVELVGPRSVRVERAEDDLLRGWGDPVNWSSLGSDFGESSSTVAEEGRGG